MGASRLFESEAAVKLHPGHVMQEMHAESFAHLMVEKLAVPVINRRHKPSRKANSPIPKSSGYRLKRTTNSLLAWIVSILFNESGWNSRGRNRNKTNHMISHLLKLKVTPPSRFSPDRRAGSRYTEVPPPARRHLVKPV